MWRPEPTDGSDEDGPEKDQSAGSQPGKDVKVDEDVVTELGLQWVGRLYVYTRRLEEALERN